MAINLRKTDTKTDLELYNEHIANHKQDVHTIVGFVGIDHVDYSQSSTCDEALRFSLLIKKRLERILERQISFEELSMYINVMDNVVKQVCHKKQISYGAINYRRRVEIFIETWKLNELEEYTNEFIYYAREIDREAAERKAKEKTRTQTTSTEPVEFLDDQTYHV